MNKLIRTLICIATAGLIAGAAHAETAFKPVVIDLAKVFDNHYKTEEVVASLNTRKQKVGEQLELKRKEMQTLVDQFQELIEQSKNTVLKPEARAQAETDAQKLAEKVQAMQGEAQAFQTRQNNLIQQSYMNHREGLMGEITLIVTNIAKARGATIVFDKSVSPVTGLPGLIYSDEGYDITDEVLKEVNKDRPAPPPAPAVTAPPAPTTAPAATPESAK